MTTRTPLALMLALALASGCPSDDESNDTTNNASDMGTTPTTATTTPTTTPTTPTTVEPDMPDDMPAVVIPPITSLTLREKIEPCIDEVCWRGATISIEAFNDRTTISATDSTGTGPPEEVLSSEDAEAVKALMREDVLVMAAREGFNCPAEDGVAVWEARYFLSGEPGLKVADITACVDAPATDPTTTVRAKMFELAESYFPGILD